MAALADTDGAELDAGVPQTVGPAPQELLNLLGRASVVKSKSGLNLPNSASRTEPPTRYSSWPAASNADSQPAQHGRVLIQGYRSGGKQLDIGFGHVRSA